MPQDVSGAQAHTCRTPRLGPPGQSWLRHVALPWLTSAGWRGFAVVAVVLLQFAVPLLALLQPPPTRFGFQMYSGRGGAEVRVVDDSGESHPVPMDRVAAIFRPELNWTRYLPEYLCSTRHHAVAIHVRQAEQSRSLSCGR